ncbi:hypothetical protein [Streptomyces albus]|uniref:hypothetical protein n=1 Tax=Streptomyces albus TaxID=1888 RepID=UPI0034031FD6
MTCPEPSPCTITLYPAALPSDDGRDGSRQRLLIRVGELRRSLRGLELELPGPHTEPAEPWTAATEGWEVVSIRPGTFRLRARDTGVAAPGVHGTVDIELTAALPDVDPVPLTVTAQLGTEDDPATVTTHHRLDNKALPAIVGFRGKNSLVVKYGACAVLTWQRAVPDTAGYLLQRHDSKGSTGKMKLSSERLSCEDSYVFTYEDDQPLRRATAYTLYYNDEQLNQEVQATSLILVTQGDIDAGRLSAAGKVSLLRAPQSAVKAGRLTAARTSQPAPTDGMLMLTLRTEKDNEVVRVHVQVTPVTNQPTTSHWLETRRTARHEHLNLPVGQGARVTLKPHGGQPMLDAVWFPFGLAGPEGRLVFPGLSNSAGE